MCPTDRRAVKIYRIYIVNPKTITSQLKYCLNILRTKVLPSLPAASYSQRAVSESKTYDSTSFLASDPHSFPPALGIYSTISSQIRLIYIPVARKVNPDTNVSIKNSTCDLRPNQRGPQGQAPYLSSEERCKLGR